MSLIILVAFLGVIFLSVAPMLVLWQTRKRAKSGIRFFIVGVAEILVLFLLFSALFPEL